MLERAKLLTKRVCPHSATQPGSHPVTLCHRWPWRTRAESTGALAPRWCPWRDAFRNWLSLDLPGQDTLLMCLSSPADALTVSVRQTRDSRQGCSVKMLNISIRDLHHLGLLRSDTLRSLMRRSACCSGRWPISCRRWAAIWRSWLSAVPRRPHLALSSPGWKLLTNEQNRTISMLQVRKSFFFSASQQKRMAVNSADSQACKRRNDRQREF
jgi:hypothetical protein